MRKKLIKTFAICSSFALTTITLSSCTQYDYTLVIYNWEDYIFEGTDEIGNIEAPSTVDKFQKYYFETYGKTVYVDYETFSTPEDMYNQMKAGSIHPDLICPSDYMIQKMQSEGMLEAFDYDIESEEYGDKLSNFRDYGSPYIKNLFKEEGFSTFAVPYFWGTMGYLYDPENVDISDASTWELQFNLDYKGKIALKDSIRDTYATVILHVYQDEVNSLKDAYNNQEITAEEYNNELSKIFNRCDNETLKKAEDALISLKSNIYGLETDDGKNEMVKGTYWINTAWSGDAVYAMDQADELDKTLNYIIPDEGSNVWFDGWCMPKGANKDLAQEFVNFICDPEIAAECMEYTGYTSPIVGDAIWDLVLDWYSVDPEQTDADMVDLSFYFGTDDAIIYVDSEERGRQFDAQYPDEETLVRCCIMKDFGSQTGALNQMWSNFKAAIV